MSHINSLQVLRDSKSMKTESIDNLTKGITKRLLEKYKPKGLYSEYSIPFKKKSGKRG